MPIDLLDNSQYSSIVILSKPSRDSFDSQNAKGFLFVQNDTGGRAEESLCKE